MVNGDQLVSPFADVELPDNGIATDVSYYVSRRDLQHAARYLNPDTTALTRGTITGTIRPDPVDQTYDIFGHQVELPPCRIGQTYRVDRIITNATGLRYNIPVHPWS